MDRRVQAALRLIEEGYTQRLTVTGLAARAGLNRSRFEHLFKQETGLTPKNCLRQSRLTAAKGLLRNGTLSIKQVAAELGYRHCPDFSRDFRERFGITPSQCRRELTTEVRQPRTSPFPKK